MNELRKYGEAATINFELFKVDGIDFRIDAIYASGDVKIMKNEGAEANTTNSFTDEGTGYSLVLTVAEMTAARIVLYFIDQTATKVWLDRKIIIETYGHASAQHPYFGEGLLDRALTGATHNVPTSAGRRLRAIGDVTSGSVDDVAATVNSFITDLTGIQADHYADQTLFWTSGNLAGMSRSILSYNESTKLVTIEEDLPEAPADGDNFDINPVHIHPVSQIVQEIIDEPTAGNAELLSAILTRLASRVYGSSINPTAVAVTDGTIISGSVSSADTINQVYLKVQETGKFKLDFDFTGLSSIEDIIYVIYRYFGHGSTNHKIECLMWNYVTSAWDDMLSTDKDFPSSEEDSLIHFHITGTVSDYFTGASPNIAAKVRIDHVSNFTIEHQFWVDYITLGDLEQIYTPADNIGITYIKEAIDVLLPTGDRAITLQLYETGTTTPIADVVLTIYNSDETILVAFVTTDINGQVVVNLDDDTYVTRPRKVGTDLPATEIIIVTADATEIIYGDTIIIATPADPDVCRVYDYLYLPDGVSKPATVIAEATIQELPYNVDGKLHAGTIIQEVYNSATGLIYWDIVKGAAVRFEVEDFISTTKIVPDTDTQRLIDIA